ncbi:hypothetical protein FSP39_002759 [Pinctada imbricata]|uniref:G-protein coupled receptors family 1 profile domain-containing protein n=1 Tax=Pinctada imbricata TaxID=66713 RepID=A0AA89BSZ1_PINIB|nr:hypothetical protein FSP39_002759 [Pinctada imbricata]
MKPTDIKLYSNDSYVFPGMYNFTTNTSTDQLTSGLNCDVILADKAPPPPVYSKEVSTFIGAVLSVFPLVTLSGNSLVIIAVFTHKRLRTITNAFVVSLSVADFLVALLVMPFAVYQQFNDKKWGLGHYMCKIVTCLDIMTTTSSIMHLSCLAVDRYLAICRPFVHERLTNRIVCAMLTSCWILPMFISFLPILNEWNLIGIEDVHTCMFGEYDTHCGLIVNIPFALICSTIAFYIPAIFMIICNIKIYLAARKQAHHIRTLEASLHKHNKRKLKQETKAAKTIGIIMGCFCVCWFPFFIVNVIDPLIGHKITYVPWTIALWLGYLNSMLNPFLYYNFNRSFKTAFNRLLTCKVCQGVREFEETDPPSTTSYHNGTGHHCNALLPTEMSTLTLCH